MPVKSFARTKPYQAYKGNLPSPLSSFIGRELEVAHVRELVSSARLVTLTGVGGSGKTRLAIRVATELRHMYRDGAWWVDLSPLGSESFVPQSIAQVLGVSDVPTKTLTETLVHFLRDKHLLLVLDNCEHVIQTCAVLCQELLLEAFQLAILTTSREALRVAGEHVFVVPTLTVPQTNTTLSRAEALEYESVRLLVERAQEVAPQFVVSDESARTASDICRALDGIPLAIELAAAWCNVLTVKEIAARLGDRLRFLTRGRRNVPPRQQTLRATMDWSFEHLSGAEQMLLRRLAVFTGGFELEAAETVCADAQFRSGQVLEALAGLTARSLLFVENDGTQSRYRMLETIREYAWEKLNRSMETNPVRDLHLNFFLNLAEMADSQLHGPAQLAWLNRLETEHDNLRTALAWSLEGEDNRAQEHIAAGLRLVVALAFFWETHSHWREALAWFDRVLQSELTESPTLKTARANALATAGWLACWQYESKYALGCSKDSLGLFRELGDVHGIGIALGNLAHLADRFNNFTEADQLASESVELLARTGDHHRLGRILALRGYIALVRQNNYARADEFYTQFLELARADGDVQGIAVALGFLSSCARFQGEYERAYSLLQEGLPVIRQLGRKDTIAEFLLGFGELEICRGNYALAAGLLQESHAILEGMGATIFEGWLFDLLGLAASGLGEYEKAAGHLATSMARHLQDKYQQGIAENLAGFGAVALGLGQLDRAAQLFGAVEAFLESIGTELGPADKREYRRNVSATRAQLKTSRFETAWTAGRAMTPEQAIRLATAPEPNETRSVAIHRATPRAAAKQQFAGLTERERQVAARVAQGMSNREIAHELVLSERTVETHVSNILNKLGFTSRAQIRKWAIQKGWVNRDRFPD